MTSYEERIREARPHLSPSLRRLADYLLDSYIQVSFLTATELAHTLDLDPATVVRFSQRVGYPGYPELQREIRDKVRRELLTERETDESTPSAAAESALQEAAHHLELVRRSFPYDAAEALLKLLDEAQRVILLAEGPALPPAQVLTGWLQAAGYTVQLVGGSPADLGRAIAGAASGDLALALEVTEETPFVGRALAEARRAGTATAAIVSAASSEVALHADVVVTTHSPSDPALRQLALSACIYALSQMLASARPGRFQKGAERARELSRLLSANGPARERRLGRPKRS